MLGVRRMTGSPKKTTLFSMEIIFFYPWVDLPGFSFVSVCLHPLPFLMSAAVRHSTLPSAAVVRKNIKTNKDSGQPPRSRMSSSDSSFNSFDSLDEMPSYADMVRRRPPPPSPPPPPPPPPSPMMVSGKKRKVPSSVAALASLPTTAAVADVTSVTKF